MIEVVVDQRLLGFADGLFHGVKLLGKGTCHTGARSCFFNDVEWR